MRKALFKSSLILLFIICGFYAHTIPVQAEDLPACGTGYEYCQGIPTGASSSNYPTWLACTSATGPTICCPSQRNMEFDSQTNQCRCITGYTMLYQTDGCVDPAVPTATPWVAPTATPRSNGGNGGGWNRGTAGNTGNAMSGAAMEVNRDTLDALNPLTQLGNPGVTGQLNTPGAVITRFLGSFAFPIAGLILFIMLVWGGFEILSGAASKKSMDAGRQRIQSALLGFFLLFISYWIVQLIEYVFGVTIL